MFLASVVCNCYSKSFYLQQNAIGSTITKMLLHCVLVTWERTTRPGIYVTVKPAYYLRQRYGVGGGIVAEVLR